MHNRNMFILVVSMLLFISFSASASALIMSGIHDEPVRVSVVLDDSGSERWSAFLAGLEQAGKDTGIRVSVVTTGKNTSISQQYAIVREEIASGAEGIILQVTNSEGTEEMISDISSKAVLELVDTSASMDVDVEGKSACIEADNREVGRALANEVRIALGRDLTGVRIGIVDSNRRKNSNIERMEGFMENIESSGAVIAWKEYSKANIADNISQKQQGRYADVIVALDNTGLEAAGEYASSVDNAPFIFGEGISIINVSYLDHGLIRSMIVPNEYYMGYQSLATVKKRMENRLTPMENEYVTFRVVNKDNLFDEVNQRMLFPVLQ
ncbi:MAG: substrate-binding domain-containing protein [Butyrivibrio sp.]|nr:substrate-binding domain-containing protein [Butyrivibrio sp.]